MLDRVRDKRRRQRVRARRAALIKCDGNAKPIRCVLWDLSEKGARIAAPYSDRLPEVFTLINDKQTSHLCRVKWRKGPLLGVQFLEATGEGREPAGAQSPKPPQAEPARSLLDSIKLPAGAHGMHDSATQNVSLISFAAASFLLTLVALTFVFYLAGHESGSGVAWAAEICQQANNMCQHPEFSGGASVLMAIVYFAAKGMEL